MYGCPMGAVCESCGHDMRTVTTCIEVPVETVDGPLAPIPYGSEKDDWGGGACHDCGADRPGFHHPGCDFEECPRCGDQLITCGCIVSSEEPQA
jgi:hypothetical protein